MKSLLTTTIFCMSLAHLTAAPKTFTLHHDLTLGGPDAEDIEMFSSTTKLVVHTDGTMYVLDSGNFRISVFDQEGEFQFQFGRQGQGPGEFSEPVAMAGDQKGNLVVFDTGTHKAIYFDSKGEYQKEAFFPNSIHGVYTPILLENGNIAFTAYKLASNNSQLVYELMLLDPELKQTKAFFTSPTPPADWDRIGQPSFWSDFLKGQFTAVAVDMPLVARSGDHLAIAQKRAYEGQLVDHNGNIKGKFARNVKPRPLSDEAKYALCEPIFQDLAANPALGSRGLNLAAFNRALEQSDDLKSAPPVFALASLGEHFAVLTDYDLLEQKGRLDVFNQKGELVAYAEYPGNHQFITAMNNHLYSVGYNEDDEIVINRYRIEGL